MKREIDLARAGMSGHYNPCSDIRTGISVVGRDQRKAGEVVHLQPFPCSLSHPHGRQGVFNSLAVAFKQVLHVRSQSQSEPSPGREHVGHQRDLRAPHPLEEKGGSLSLCSLFHDGGDLVARIELPPDPGEVPFLLQNFNESTKILGHNLPPPGIHYLPKSSLRIFSSSEDLSTF